MEKRTESVPHRRGTAGAARGLPVSGMCWARCTRFCPWSGSVNSMGVSGSLKWTVLGSVPDRIPCSLRPQLGFQPLQQLHAPVSPIFSSHLLCLLVLEAFNQMGVGTESLLLAT